MLQGKIDKAYSDKRNLINLLESLAWKKIDEDNDFVYYTNAERDYNIKATKDGKIITRFEKPKRWSVKYK